MIINKSPVTPFYFCYGKKTLNFTPIIKNKHKSTRYNGLYIPESCFVEL